MHVNREGISLLRFLLFLSSCLFCAHAPATQAIQASYIVLHFDVAFRSTWIEEFGIHPGTRVIYFFKYTCVALGCGSIKKESYEERSIIWQLPYRNWKATALPWIPKMVSFIISIPALFHMGGSMYAMVVSFPSTFPLLLLPQRLLHFSHYNSVHNVTNA